MNGAQKSKLLKQIQEEAKSKLSIVSKEMNSTLDEIEGIVVDRDVLNDFKSTLEHACQINNIDEMKTLLTEDAIPFDMLMSSETWEKLQRLIFELHEKDNEEFER